MNNSINTRRLIKTTKFHVISNHRYITNDDKVKAKQMEFWSYYEHILQKATRPLTNYILLAFILLLS